MTRILQNPFYRYGLIIGTMVVGVTLFFPEFIRGLIQPDGFMPHSTCYLQNAKVIRLHVISDLAIGIAYVCISCTLGFLVYKASENIPFHWMFLAFGLFIVTCGLTHFMEVWTVWTPLYWLAGYVKVICAVASVTTAIALFPLVPKIFALINSVKVSEERKAQLQSAYGEMESFAYSVSHDLRAPLRAIQGMAVALNEDHGARLSPEARAYLERILQASGKMDTLIRDLLEYSRVTRAEFPLQQTDIAACLADATQTVSADLERTKAKIELESSLPPVMANRRLLTQVLTNLVGNAVKFVKAGVTPEIKIYAHDVGNSIRLHVKDNGIGIAPEYQTKVFRMFERLHAADEYPGTGIGLAIVQKAVERMNGTMGLDSAPNRGSCFWIDLPKPS